MIDHRTRPRRTGLASGDVDAYITNFQARALHDAWLEATAIYWERRARAFEDARPRLGDFMGAAASHDHLERYERLTETAIACRSKASCVYVTAVELLRTLEACVDGDLVGDRSE